MTKCKYCKVESKSYLCNYHKKIYNKAYYKNTKGKYLITYYIDFYELFKIKKVNRVVSVMKDDLIQSLINNVGISKNRISFWIYEATHLDDEQIELLIKYINKVEDAILGDDEEIKKEEIEKAKVLYNNYFRNKERYKRFKQRKKQERKKQKVFYRV